MNLHERTPSPGSESSDLRAEEPLALGRAFQAEETAGTTTPRSPGRHERGAVWCCPTRSGEKETKEKTKEGPKHGLGDPGYCDRTPGQGPKMMSRGGSVCFEQGALLGSSPFVMAPSERRMH